MDFFNSLIFFIKLKSVRRDVETIASMKTSAAMKRVLEVVRRITQMNALAVKVYLYIIQLALISVQIISLK